MELRRQVRSQIEFGNERNPHQRFRPRVSRSVAAEILTELRNYRKGIIPSAYGTFRVTLKNIGVTMVNAKNSLGARYGWLDRAFYGGGYLSGAL
jgi:hypothetical protein